MQDGTNEPTEVALPAALPAALPVPAPAAPAPAAGRRSALLLALGGGVGLVVGVLLTVGVTTTYTLFTQTLPATRDSVQVFNELNELRQQINQLNDEKKLKDQEKDEAVRMALDAVASTVRAPEALTPSKKAGGAAEARPVARAQDGFAEIDEEIERLEQTQKVLNTILDMFSKKGKERPKER
jgi:hypothetical protein